jgi:hypothetical protein
MSRELIESIISNNMLEANDMVEAKLAEIRERKIYEMKRMFAAKMDEALGSMSKAEIQLRRDAGYVRASASKEKGGLGPSEYDKAQEKIKARREKAAKAKKHKVAEEALDEMRAPGEVPGSPQRQQDAAKLRKLRQDLADAGQDRRLINKPYLAKRKSQMATPTNQPSWKSKIADRLGKEKKRWTDRLDKLSARHLSRHDVEGGKSTWERSAGGKVASVATHVGKKLASAPVTQDIKDIGFRNL